MQTFLLTHRQQTPCNPRPQLKPDPAHLNRRRNQIVPPLENQAEGV